MKYLFDNIHQVAKICISVLWWMCYKSKFNLHTYYLPNADSFITFKLSYCGILPINCPSQEDFEYFDDDKNGILTWSEWKLKSGWYGHEPDLRKKDTKPCYEQCYELLFSFRKFVSMWPYLYHVSFYVNANKKIEASISVLLFLSDQDLLTISSAP